MAEKLKASNTWVTLVVNIFRFIMMLGISFVILYPFVARIAGSFMSKEDVVDSTVSLIPKNPTLDIYHYIIVENHYFEALMNTLLLSLLCAIIQTFVACLVGYGLAKFKFKGNALVMGVVVLTMVIPHRALQESIIQHFSSFDFMKVLSWDYQGPIELIVNALKSTDLDEFKDLKIPDFTATYWPMIILSIFGLAFKNGLYIYLMRQFFKGVPDELEESAYVDGSDTFRTFFQIILPLAVPMMVTIFLFSFSWQWTDEFYTRMFFSTDINKVYMMPDVYATIPPSLNFGYAGQAVYNNVIRNTAGMLIIAPLIVMYLFCQKYLVAGIERSGIVG